jgi:2-(3-amino-3-carboxypropyl)histidine synthase
MPRSEIIFDLEEEKIINAITERGASRVLLQMPEGLLAYAAALSWRLEARTGAEVIVSADPCYGACDLALIAKDRLGADLLVHFGHAEIPRTEAKGVLFVEARCMLNIQDLIATALKVLVNEKRVGLAATVQHIHMLPFVKTYLEQHGKTVLIGPASHWLKYDGQILGCDYSSVKAISKHVDAFLVLAGGRFHALGICLATGVRTLALDPFTRMVEDVSSLCAKTMRQRWAAIERFREAKNIGIVIGLKSGQMKLDVAQELKKTLEEKGKRCTMISAIELIPELLESFTDLDGFVEVACPRISIDDQARLNKPLLNIEETLIAIGERSWDDYAKTFTSEAPT